MRQTAWSSWRTQTSTRCGPVRDARAAGCRCADQPTRQAGRQDVVGWGRGRVRGGGGASVHSPLGLLCACADSQPGGLPSKSVPQFVHHCVLLLACPRLLTCRSLMWSAASAWCRLTGSLRSPTTAPATAYGRPSGSAWAQSQMQPATTRCVCVCACLGQAQVRQLCVTARLLHSTDMSHEQRTLWQ